MEIAVFWVTCNVKSLLANLCSWAQATIDKQRQSEWRITKSVLYVCIGAGKSLTLRNVHRDNVGAM